MKKKLLIFCLFVTIGAIFLYNYIYKNHRDISTEKESFTLTIQDLKNDFQNSDSLANAKYLDKTIVVYGKISNLDITNNVLTIDSLLTATLKEKLDTLKLNDSIKLKGRFIGFDDLLFEFKMDECTILK